MGRGPAEQPDTGLRLHLDRGARLLRLVPGYRPEDSDNLGHALLIRYQAAASEGEPEAEVVM